MSIKGVYCVNVQQHWSPWMRHWCLLEVCTTSMCSNTDYLEWHLDVYWGCVLRECAATLITLNDILMSTGGMCTTSMCSNTDDVEWHHDVYWRVRTTTMCSNTDHLEWHIDVYWRCVLHQCPATLITLNETLMSIGGVYYVNVQQHWSPWMTSWCLLEECVLHQCAETLMTLNDILMSTGRCVLQQCAATLITLNDTLMSIGGVYYVNVQQHWSPWMASWCLMEVCTTSMSSNTDHFEWDLHVYWRCVLRQCAATLITLNDILMSIEGVYCFNVQQH
jgi:metal-sulfur cluster biosynthetic enzyme